MSSFFLHLDDTIAETQREGHTMKGNTNHGEEKNVHEAKRSRRRSAACLSALSFLVRRANAIKRMLSLYGHTSAFRQIFRRSLPEISQIFAVPIMDHSIMAVAGGSKSLCGS